MDIPPKWEDNAPKQLAHSHAAFNIIEGTHLLR
jgi:hypothetical protein